MSDAIWALRPSLDQLNRSAHTMIGHLGIEVTELGDDFIRARMPVDQRTVQPAGLLHGGASVALAETLGSMGAMLCVDPARFQVVGLEINANHVRGVRHGWVTGTARPLHRGSRTIVVETDVFDEAGKHVARVTQTQAVL